MILKETILLSLTFFMSVGSALYTNELQQSIDNGEVVVLQASSRSVEHKVQLKNKLPNLVIFCYTHGATQRTLLSLWKTVKFQLLSAGETTMVYGESEEVVYRQWLDNSGIIRYWFTPWKVDNLIVTPFNATCIGASSVEHKDFNINLVISESIADLESWMFDQLVTAPPSPIDVLPPHWLDADELYDSLSLAALVPTAPDLRCYEEMTSEASFDAEEVLMKMAVFAIERLSPRPYAELWGRISRMPLDIHEECRLAGSSAQDPIVVSSDNDYDDDPAVDYPGDHNYSAQAYLYPEPYN